MEPKISNRPAFTVVGMKYRGKNENKEIPQLWQKFKPRMDEVKHKVNPHVCYGVMDNFDMKSGEFDYVAGFEVKSTADVPEDMVCWEVPEQTYAVFPCTLPNIVEAFRHVCKEWLPQSGYQRTDGPEFELYDENFQPDEGKLDMYIYIPIKKP